MMRNGLLTFAGAAAVVASALRVRSSPRVIACVCGSRAATSALESPSERRVRIGDHLTLAAREWGPKDGHRVLALHGWLDNASSFDLVAPHFTAAGFRVVAVDMPGHGKSDHRPKDSFYHLIDNVADVCAFVDELGWDHFTIVGHSLGGAVGCFVAATWPDRVDGVVMIESLGPWTTKAAELPAQLAKSIAKRSHRPPRVHPSLEEAAVANSKGLLQTPLPATRVMVRRAVKKREEGYVWRADPRLRERSRLPMTEDVVEAFVSAVKCPTMVVLAKDGIYAGRTDEELETRKARFSDLTTAEVDEGGHHVHLIHPKQVAQHATTFLRSCL